MRADEALAIKNDAIARLAQAFTNPVRLQILGILEQGEAPVEVLAEKIGQSGANTSAQLRHLAAAHLVVSRREGRHIYYRLASAGVRRLRRALQEVAATSAPELRELSREWFEPSGEVDRPAGLALLERVQRGDVLLLDVRPPDEHAQGHLPGSRNVSAREVESAVDDLEPGRPVFVYCRGHFCVQAADCVRRLRARGVQVTNLAMGVSDWEAAGLPVVRGGGSVALVSS